MRSLGFAFAIVLACGAGAVAAAHADDRVDCKNAMTQNDMNICADQDFRASDAKLNETYKALLAKLSEPEKAQIKDAQRAWLAYRDAECKFTIRQNEGGSIYPMMWSGCLTQKTDARLKELRAHLDCANDKPGCAE